MYVTKKSLALEDNENLKWSSVAKFRIREKLKE